MTPAWAVAGVVLLGTGVVYTLIGIKMQRLHTFLSAGFLASLGTAVLIIYIMVLPVSDAIQGAYLVAVVCTGLILGGAAIVFPEITEGLGCLLGGFCLSMWMLTLQEGGLLVPTGSKVVFIACFSVGAFAFYFSHWTRTYALIGCISFAGATAAVLGIDCFSRAGLKEFWAYIWALNNNLFPLGADTYPLTRGIRVELAATVLIFLAGIVSQLKLWRIIKERRIKKDAEKAEGQRHQREEDDAAGRQVEELNARERREWEAVYGDGERGFPSSPALPSDSGVGDMESEKVLRHSQGTTVSKSQVQTHTREVGNGPSEMDEIPLDGAPPAVPPKSQWRLSRLAAEVVMVQDEDQGQVTVRVARDDVPEVQADRTAETPDAGKVWVVGTDGEARLAAGQPKRTSKGSAVLSSPGIVPLPFRIPAADDRDVRNDDDRSSVATFAEDEERSVALGRKNSLAKRLSQGSVDLLRSLSQRSRRKTADKAELQSESWEELVGSRLDHRDDDGSVAATIDGMSSDGGDNDTIRDGERPRSIEISAELGAAPTMERREDANAPSAPDRGAGKERPTSNAETVATDILDVYETNGPAETTSPVSNTDEPTSQITPTKDTAEGDLSTSVSDEGAKKTKSVASVDSAPASITKARLPRALSRIAMSYRTNEWAKHLSNAELPEPQPLQLGDYSQESHQETTAEEEAAPLNMAELQQTAENAAPPPAAPRSASVMSNYPSTPSLPIQGLSRSDSRQSIASPTPEPPLRSVNPTAGVAVSPTTSYQNYANQFRNISSTSLNRRPSHLLAQPIAEENDGEQDSGPASPTQDGSTNSGPTVTGHSATPPERSTSSLSLSRPPVPGVVSYSSPQTLIGRREMLLRNKSQGSFTPEPFALPTIPSQPTSDAGSLYHYHPAAPGGTALLSPGGTSTIDLDDLPMSQRREVMRHSSLVHLAGGSSRPGSVTGFSAPPPAHAAPATAIPFDSHQPTRGGTHLPTPAAREAALANFRHSVSAELRAGTPVVPTGGGRETPTLLSAMAGGAGAGYAGLLLPTAGRDAEARQSIDAQRSYLLGQKEAEAQRREMDRLDKENSDRAFEERWRRGDMLEAHRDAMRRMQAGAKGS